MQGTYKAKRTTKDNGVINGFHKMKWSKLLNRIQYKSSLYTAYQ